MHTLIREMNSDTRNMIGGAAIHWDSAMEPNTMLRRTRASRAAGANRGVDLNEGSKKLGAYPAFLASIREKIAVSLPPTLTNTDRI